MHILHIISGLQSGGAEGVLYRLIKEDKKNKHSIISFSEGFYFKEFVKIGVDIKIIKLKNIFFFLKVIQIILNIKKKDPDIIQSWMYHADFITIFIKLFYKKRIFWNIRNTIPELEWSKFSTIAICKICSYFSNIVPYRIVSCSNSGAIQHYKFGYEKKKIKIIFNGFDDKIFKRNKNIRKVIRKKLNIKKNYFLIGCFARNHPQKDHATLLQAFQYLCNDMKNIKLLLIGQNLKNILIENKMEKLKSKIIILDPLKGIEKMYFAIDLFVLPSIGYEGFPNVIAEAMLSEINCFSTDVGDSKLILGKFGKIINKKDPENLYKLIKSFVIKRKYLNKKGRKYIQQKFSIQKMLDHYNNVWTSK